MLYKKRKRIAEAVSFLLLVIVGRRSATESRGQGICRRQTGCAAEMATAQSNRVVAARLPKNQVDQSAERSCEVHKLPAHDVDGNDIYTLTGAGKRCNCKVNVEDFVVTVHGWSDSEDVRLCPNHFLQLYKRSDVLRVETIAECDSRLRQEEGAGAQSEQQSARAPVRASPQSSARSAASTSSLSFAGVAAADSVEEWDARGYPARGVDRVGKPYGAAGQLVGGAAAEGQQQRISVVVLLA